MMLNIPIVFTIDKAFLAPAYVAISSLVDHAEDTTQYEIIVLYQGRIDQYVETLSEIVKGSRHKLIIRDISNIKMNVPKITRCWPSIVYVRLYLSSVLCEYDKVIFSDVDVFFLGDLAKVYITNIEGIEWAGVAAENNNQGAIVHQYYEDNKHPFIYWAGFMVMNLKEMRNSNWEKRCNDNLNKYSDMLYMCDLEILNITAKGIKRLPMRYVYLQSLYDAKNIEQAEDYPWLINLYSKEEMLEEREKAIIIHYAGKVGRIGKIWLRLKPAEYYNLYLKKLPPILKRLNNIKRIRENMKVLIKIILEKVHIMDK